MQAVGCFRASVERPDLHRGDALLEKRLRELVGAVQERVEVLVRTFGSAQAPVRAGLLTRVADIAIAGAGVVGADRVAARAPKDLVERLVAELAVEVPERNVERGHSTRLDPRAAKAEIARKAARQALDLQRVLAEHPRRNEFMQVRFHALGSEARLSQSDQPFVGMQPQPDEVREFAEAQGFEL